MLLSVLVPVYNVASFLERCVNSLLIMPLEAYEIILVDDGSTDRSGEFCDELQDKYKCIKVVHQTHQGLVAARSAALDIAEGEYIAFVDSDDWVDKELLPSLVSRLETCSDVDIAVGRAVRSMDGNTNMAFLSRVSGQLDRDQALKAMVNKDGMHWYLWGKVYRRRLFSGLSVDPNVTVFEDLDRLWPVAMRARKFFFDDRYAYHYYMNPEGMTEKRCDLNTFSWRVFKRILLGGYPVGCVKQVMTNYYVQVFLRHTLEMYFVNREGYKDKISMYIQELKDTLHAAEAKQNIVPDEDYKMVSFDYNNCIDFYDRVFLKLKVLLWKICDSCSAVYIYGTGVIAQYIATVMKDMGILPAAFVVSDGQVRKYEFMGQKVLYLSEVKMCSNMAFVLALSGTAKEKVLKILHDTIDRSAEIAPWVIPVEFPPIVF